MQTTILLTRYELGVKISRYLFFVLGAAHALQGINRLIDKPLTTGSVVLAVVILLIGLLLIFFGFTLFNPAIGFAPKISVSEEKIIIREDIFTRTRYISWTGVDKIIFGSYSMIFIFSDGREKKIILRTNAQGSIEVKKLVRAWADKKSVAVLGG